MPIPMAALDECRVDSSPDALPANKNDKVDDDLFPAIWAAGES